MQAQQPINKIPIFDPQQQQKVGITQFITKGIQIPAITKYLLSDFIVNEIDMNGNVVVVENKPLSIKYQQDEKKQVNYEMTKQLYDQIEKNLSQQAAKEIQTLYEKLQCGEKNVEWEYIMQNVAKQKSQRLKLHNFVRQKLENIQSNTLDGNKIRLKYNRKLKKINPQSRHKYIHFKLYKCNIDTMGALFKLSKICGISHKIFSSAGLKDKRGITTQMVSVFNSDINNLKRFYQQADRNRQIWIDGFQENKNDAIGVGCLFGNQFGLVLRLIDKKQGQQLIKRIQTIKENGIINYFGMQRFGSCATKTHLIGIRIIKRQWKQIVEELLLQETNIEQVNRIKLQLYQNKQYNKAQKQLSNKFKIQKYLFKGLAKHGNNFYNVFESLPRSIKTLYCHALQSYLWNKVTSRRIKEHGLKLVIGDIVGIVPNNQKNKINEDTNQNNLQKKQNQGQNEKKQIELPEQELAEEIQAQDIEDTPMEIIQITQENIHKYNFTDLVAPLYGISVNLPQNCIINKYLQQQLVELRLTKADFQDKAKNLCFKGAYRKCIVKPPKISCDLVWHKQKKTQILSPFYMKGEKPDYEQGQLCSAKVILQLPKSSYATIAIRQILHIPSSFKVQTQLNKLYDKI